jgi:hypothetical protein
MSTSSNNSSTKLSRGEVEVLTVLHAVGTAGCRVSDLPGRLGLSVSLTAAVAEGVQPMVVAGLLLREDDVVMVSAAGKARLTARLTELGLG